jgi:hypothetical protein
MMVMDTQRAVMRGLPPLMIRAFGAHGHFRT